MAVDFSRTALETALQEAEGWAEDGYSDTSCAYWAGMRDTLKVLLGYTTEVPTATGTSVDAAAISILGAEQRNRL